MFSAGNPMSNASISEAHQLMALLAAQKIEGAELFVCPVGVPGANAGALIPEAQFTENGVPTNAPIYLMITVTGKPDAYTVGMIWFMFAIQGIPLASCLV
jgi:hypothetical protein